MSTNDETIEQPEADPIAEAILNADENTVLAQPDIAPDDASDAAPDVTPEDLILGKFKSSDDLAEAYKHLEAQFTQNNQRLSDLEALLTDDEEEEQPAASWGKPFQGEPENEEQLVGWAEKDPAGAAQWAIANANRVPEEVVNAVWEHWHERKPAEAMAWYTHQQTLQLQQQYEERIAQIQAEVAPLRDAQTQTMFEGAINELELQIPDIADYSEKIQEYIDGIPPDQFHVGFFPHGMDTPEKIKEGVRSLYAIVRMREAPMVAEQQAHQQMANQAFTQSRQGIVDTGPADYDARINDAILNA